MVPKIYTGDYNTKQTCTNNMYLAYTPWVFLSRQMAKGQMGPHLLGGPTREPYPNTTVVPQERKFRALW